MELLGVRVDSSGPGRARLTGHVRYDSAPGGEEAFWFDVPERFSEELSASGNPWLTCLAPLAARLGEPLRIGLPVDRLLARNVRELLRIWKAWYSDLEAVPLELEYADTVLPLEAPRRTGAFFSGGVDSFYTVLRSQGDRRGAVRPDDLILVRGFDFPLEDAAAFERHRIRMLAAADALGLELVDIATNLRETRLRQASWATLWHGSALASVGLALERRYRYLLIASSSTYAELEPYGSHPMTDALHSTASTAILHEGAEATRLDKVAYVAGSDLALKFLHVCFREVSELNCGRCRKCSFALLGLMLLGAGDRCPTFPSGGPDLDRVRRIHFTPAQRHGVRRLRALALRQGRRDVLRALDAGLRRSALVGAALGVLDRLGRVPPVSGVALRLRRKLIGRVVR